MEGRRFQAPSPSFMNKQRMLTSSALLGLAVAGSRGRTDILTTCFGVRQRTAKTHRGLRGFWIRIALRTGTTCASGGKGDGSSTKRVTDGRSPQGEFSALNRTHRPS